MEVLALLDCLSTPACLLSQAVGGLKIGMLLFLVASGLTPVSYTHLTLPTKA